MYRGFKLEPIEVKDQVLASELMKIGNDLYADQKAVCETNLKKFLFSDNVIDASAIVKSWFPTIEADIFISHSHKDKEMAILLAGYLFKNLGIRSFIDSCIWGSSDLLLKLFDDKYCRTDDNLHYKYESRNRSTSHVHMMLSNAISMMMDKTECLFFLNTPRSIFPAGAIEQTESPWLYFELGQSQVLQKREPSRFLNESYRFYSERGIIEKAIKARFTVSLSHLNEITAETLKSWRRREISSAQEALDWLYALSPLKEKNNSLLG